MIDSFYTNFMSAISMITGLEVVFIALWITLLMWYVAAIVTGIFKSAGKGARFFSSFVVVLYTITILIYSSQTNDAISGAILGIVAILGASALAAELMS